MFGGLLVDPNLLRASHRLMFGPRPFSRRFETNRDARALFRSLRSSMAPVPQEAE